MLALSFYEPEKEAVLRSELAHTFGVGAQLEGIVATPTLTNAGSFVRFDWADWPAQLSNEFAERVQQFHRERDWLKPVKADSPEWNVVFGGSVGDTEASAKIAGIFQRHFDNRISWVRCVKDLKGKITAWMRIDTSQVAFDLTWKDFNVFAIGVAGVDEQRLRKAIEEAHEWAGRRIQPILDALKQKLHELYGDRFKGLYVFGSYALPDAGIELPADSDLDVALILSDFDNPYEEIKRFGHITSDLSLEHGIVVSLVPIRERDFVEKKTNFIRVISEEAIRVA